MKIQFWAIGKNHEPYVKPGIEDFTKRISKYFPVEWMIIPSAKHGGLISETELKKKEGSAIFDLLTQDDYLVALDEGGKQFSSTGLAQFLQGKANDSTRSLIFLIGGAFGLGQPILKRADLQWSLSKLTFPHQLVRLMLSEQLYRACSILRNEKYHHA
ncbi:MAG TPA: 23S rRNA (pseudouridine(1915)-N(3))-methyltransferase RlmH [Puia sp.]|nr:23S rRNA (pseudouridine(1915)-N(3))-methyltransferase RlmH [Puia sp.]